MSPYKSLNMRKRAIHSPSVIIQSSEHFSVFLQYLVSLVSCASTAEIKNVKIPGFGERRLVKSTRSAGSGSATWVGGDTNLTRERKEPESGNDTSLLLED